MLNESSRYIFIHSITKKLEQSDVNKIKKMKNEDIFSRYSRQIFIEEIGLEGQRKIMNAKVLVIGAGGLKSAEDFVKNLNHRVNFIGIENKINDSNAEEMISQFDIIVDGSDNFKTRYLVNDICVKLKKPLVYGSILGFSGQVAIFNYNGSKNLRNIFPEPPFDENLPDCDSLGVLGALPGIVGSMMSNLALKIITDLPLNLNQITLIDTLTWRFQTIDF